MGFVRGNCGLGVSRKYREVSIYEANPFPFGDFTHLPAVVRGVVRDMPCDVTKPHCVLLPGKVLKRYRLVNICFGEELRPTCADVIEAFLIRLVVLGTRQAQDSLVPDFVGDKVMTKDIYELFGL